MGALTSASPPPDADGDGTGNVCESPDERVELLTDDVQALVAAGTLSEKDAGPLLTKLENAFADIAGGNTNGAVGKLGAFIGQVSAYMPPPNPDRLTPEEGQALIDAAQSIIDQLEA